MALMCIRPTSRLRATLASLLLVFVLSCTAYLTHEHELLDEGGAPTAHCAHCLGLGAMAGMTAIAPWSLQTFLVAVSSCPPARRGVARFLLRPYSRGPPVHP